MNVIFTWGFPETNGSGGPQDIAKIREVEVSTSADAGANWSLSDRVLVDEVQTSRVDTIPDGDWLVRLEFIGTNNKRGLPLDTPFVVDDSAPGTAMNVVITFE